MSTKKEEVIEVAVITDDLIENLSADVKENVVFLTENLKPKDLVPFNPIVKEINELKKINDIVFVEGDKECIQAYKDAKRKIGAFNTSLRDAHKEIKEPYWKIAKGIDAIRKNFSEESTNIKTNLLERFKPYIDEQERIKKEKQDAKDKEKNDKIEALSKANEESNKTVKIQQVYNLIKYTIIAKKQQEFVVNLSSMSKDAVQSTLEQIPTYKYLSVVLGDPQVNHDDYELIPQDQKEELLSDFDEMIMFLSNAYRKKLNELTQKEQEALDKAKLEGKYEEVKETASSDIPEIVPTSPIQPKESVLSDYDKTKSYVGQLVKMQNEMLIDRDKAQDQNCRQLLTNILSMLEKMNAYVGPKFQELNNANS